jgi:aerobic-type carbon monoxide dehydrogenase small subunit (CoxS/CutS family)
MASSKSTDRKRSRENPEAAKATRTAVVLEVNGKEYEVFVEPRYTLLYVLRDMLGLTGTKKVCDHGECGACTVIIDGKTVYSCLTLAIACQGKSIITIEGLAPEGELHPIQQTFLDEDGYQCGFCTPGQVLSVKALLDSTPQPSPQQIKRSVSGNLCRCGAYPKIIKAAEKAAMLYKTAAKGKERQGGNRG